MPKGQQGPEKGSVGTFNSLGCWTDGWEARALNEGSATANDMTVEKCMNMAQEFKYAGVEWGM